jgi:hypothetical protein
VLGFEEKLAGFEMVILDAENHFHEFALGPP